MYYEFIFKISEALSFFDFSFIVSGSMTGAIFYIYGDEGGWQSLMKHGFLLVFFSVKVC